MGWGSDGDEWETTGHYWLHVWIHEGMTGWQLYDGFRRAGAPCTDARVVREPSAEERLGVAALAFRHVATLVIWHWFQIAGCLYVYRVLPTPVCPGFLINRQICSASSATSS